MESDIEAAKPPQRARSRAGAAVCQRLIGQCRGPVGGGAKQRSVAAVESIAQPGMATPFASAGLFYLNAGSAADSLYFYRPFDGRETGGWSDTGEGRPE